MIMCSHQVKLKLLSILLTMTYQYKSAVKSKLKRESTVLKKS